MRKNILAEENSDIICHLAYYSRFRVTVYFGNKKLFSIVTKNKPPRKTFRGQDNKYFRKLF